MGNKDYIGNIRLCMCGCKVIYEVIEYFDKHNQFKVDFFDNRYEYSNIYDVKSVMNDKDMGYNGNMCKLLYK